MLRGKALLNSSSSFIPGRSAFPSLLLRKQVLVLKDDNLEMFGHAHVILD